MKKQDKLPVQILDIPFPETSEIERQVLADAVSAPEQLGDIIPVLHTDFFTNDNRRTIWNKIVEYYNLGKAIDLATMHSEIGLSFSQEVLPKAGISPGYFEFMTHISALRTGAARRRSYYAAVEFLQLAINNQAGEQDIVAGVERFAAQVEGPAPVQTETTLADAIKDVREDVKAAERAAAEGRSIRIPTGFEYLDRTINGGFKPGQLIVLAARPGVGKTSVMLHLAKTAAKAGNPVYISTLEMTDEELAEKFIYSTGLVRPAEVSRGSVVWSQFDDAERELAGLPILINEFSRTLEQIVSRVTQSVKRGKCRVAFIDYLGLVQDCNMFGGNAKLYQIIAKITGTLKAVAKRLEIPIVLLCQLNRDQAREGRAPELYDLRDSGSIEQDADIVLMLEPTKEKVIHAWLRKNRGGRKVDADGNDIGFKLLPNETYSAFTELGPVKQETTEDLPAATIKLPEPVTTPKDKDYLPF